jgi:carboxymethylenebutenolidase
MTNVAQDIVEETIKLTAADGHSFEAFHAAPNGASKGGLVILQEIFGLTDQLKSVVLAYARDGYDTIFPCVYDRVAPGTVVPFAEAERGRDLAYGLPLDKVVLDVGAAVDRVQSSRGVSVLGFCWGRRRDRAGGSRSQSARRNRLLRHAAADLSQPEAEMPAAVPFR